LNARSIGSFFSLATSIVDFVPVLIGAILYGDFLTPLNCNVNEN
jgi:hypothetical protein